MSLCTTNYMKNTKKKRDSNYEKLTYLCVEKSITIIQDKNILKIIEIYWKYWIYWKYIQNNWKYIENTSLPSELY